MFGPIRISRPHDVLGPGDLGGAKPKELLEVLLLARGHAVQKTALVNSLWPRDAPQNPYATLESYVSVLRKHLFTDRLQARRVLITMPGAYRFCVDGTCLDLDRFDELVVSAERSRHKRVQLLREAVDLAGGLLLEDVADVSWVQTERELYRDRVARAHLLIAADLLVAGDPVGAAGHGESVLQIRRHSEEAYQIVMLANHALGHTHLARQAFLRCRRLLANELQCDCTSETEGLGAAIDAGTPATVLIAARWPTTAPTAPQPHSSDRRDPRRRLPFIGRRSELAFVRERCERAASAGFQLVIVHGRSGLGKSAFLREAEQVVGERVGLVSYSPIDADRPSLPLAAALVIALSGTPGSSAARVYAESPMIDGSLATFGALRDVIAEHGPVSVLLDNLHWADPVTLDALEWIGREHPDLALAVIATARDPRPIAAQRPSLHALAAMVHLRPLMVNQAVELNGVDAELIRATGGIPELLADCWRWTQSGRVGLSPSLRVTVLRTVRGLGHTRSMLVAAAAQLPELFEASSLETRDPVSPQPASNELEAIIDDLCALDIFERSPRGLRFRAGAFREVFASSLPASIPASSSPSKAPRSA